MHIKTKLEMSFVHIAALAICPLMLIMTNFNQALYFIVTTSICFLIASFVCHVFNRYLSRSLKIFIVAIISAFLVTILNYVIENYSVLGLTVEDNSFFTVITTIVLSTDVVYLETKALVKNFFLRQLRILFMFAVMMSVYAVGVEFFAYGTILNKQIFKYKGFEFFETITFALIWLGLISFVVELIHRIVAKRLQEKHIAYQKFVKKIRNEKVFQYDNLRRKKLLISEIETNNIDGEKIEEIKEKESENVAVDMDEIKEKTTDESLPEDNKSKKASKNKKNKKIKVSKETKVEKIFDRQTKEDK